MSARKTPRPTSRPRKAAVAPERPAGTGHTIADMLAIATEEFAAKGYSGARVDEIAARMATSKRTIYYYFGGKEGLYLAVLEDAYRRIRALEHDIDVENLDPVEALERLVAFTFDYQSANPDFVRLVMNENILKGDFMRRSKEIQRLNVPAIDAVKRIYERGVAAGRFRPGLDPIDLHMSISALAFFNVSNRHTFSLIFKRDMQSSQAHAKRRAQVVELVLRYALA